MWKESNISAVEYGIKNHEKLYIIEVLNDYFDSFFIFKS